MSRLIDVAILCALALGAAIFLFMAALVSPLWAHDWYDRECCSGQDCAPVADGGVVEGPNGYRLPNGDTIPYGDKRIRFSPDASFHWCHAGSLTYCLYIPGRGI